MRRRKILSMVLAMALIITSMLPGFVTASADSSFYDFKLHFVGTTNSYEDVGIATIQGGQFSDGSWYQQLTPDKKDDVIIDVKIDPVREVSIAMYTSNWGQLGECTVPLSTFSNSNGSIEAWYIEGEGIVYSDPNDDGGTTTSQSTTMSTTTTSVTQSTTTTQPTTTTTTQMTTTTQTTTQTAPADGYYKLVINAASPSDVSMIIVGGCESKLLGSEPTWWYNYPANNDGIMLTVYVNPYNAVDLSFLTSGWANLGDATIPASKFTSDTLNIWYLNGEIHYSDPSGGTGTTTTSTTTTTTSATTSATTTATTATTTVTTAPDVDPPIEVDGFYINGTTLYDAKGNPFVMRGVNYSYTWFKNTAQVAIPQIAEYGANTVRIVLSNGEQWTKDSEAEVRALIELCEQYNLVAVLEVHDATGSNNKEDLLKAARYFVDIKDAFIGKEDRVIINIANEWYGEWSVDGWAQGYKEAIKVIRDAGLTHNIMVDAAGWGQYPASVHQKGKEVFNSDPLKNTIFSIHMYEYAGGNEAMVKDNIDKTLAQGLALCIGEFGWKHSGGDVDEEAILSYCEETATGWLAWSWHGNSGGVEYLDLVTDAAGKTLTEWGQTIVNSTYGMMNTSVICSVFDDSDPIPTTTTTTHTTATTQTTTGTTSSTATPTTSTTTTTNTTATTTTTQNPGGFYKKIEAEDAQMRGSVKVGSSRAGYSGTGYATGFDQSPNNGWSVDIDIPTSGHYKFTISSAADSYKENFLVLNGTSIATIVTEGTGEFETIVFDGIYIEAGTSTLSITESWGWFDLDYIQIESGEGIKSSVYTDIDTNLSNENSNAKTKAIWDYLVENYGKRVISGQYAAHNSSAEIEAIYRETGKLPALRGFDFIFMSPNTDWHCEDETQLAIDWSNQGGLVSFSWHWHSPKGPHAFYTEDTDFDLAKGVTSIDVANMPLSEVKSLYESGQISEECYLLIHDIDAISEQLAKLERNNVTVLWRPIHEASGGWFWWGSAGADAYKWLWRTMYERQTNYHNLGNLIWVWNAQNADWYVGDEYCDIVGYDVYAEYHNYSPQTDKFAEAVEYSQGNKMVALSENAVMPDPDLLSRDNVFWSWFNVWYGDFIFDGYNLNGLYTEVDMVKKIYNHETVITLDELPNF